MPSSRRDFLKKSSASLLAFEIGGALSMLSPAEARNQKIPFRRLISEQVATLEALGETLVPGAAEAGIAHYVDHQLASSPEESMLMVKYLGVAPPFDPFYHRGLAALNAASAARFKQPFAALEAASAQSLVESISTENPDAWAGPPAPFFYFVVRSDAVDVVYGTTRGFERLGIPYMAHIRPPSRW